jgi:hypothetical protein
MKNINNGFFCLPRCISLLSLSLVAYFFLSWGSGFQESSAGFSNNVAKILPEDVTKLDSNLHPFYGKIQTFLENQGKNRSFETTGLSKSDYLKIINGQVEYFFHYQDSRGAIIDPVEKIEFQYSTPCYALSVAILVNTGFTSDTLLLNSGIKAMDWAIDAMYLNRVYPRHGEFYIQNVMLAFELFQGMVAPSVIQIWQNKLSKISPYILYTDNLYLKKNIGNHNAVALAGEYLRIKNNLNGDEEFLEKHLQHQLGFFTINGMYWEVDHLDRNPPLVYDEFSRQYLAFILAAGYKGPAFSEYRDLLWKGAWTSMFMQSPFGEVPTGGRSSNHIWNEAAAAVNYEIYASQYAAIGRFDEAGAFKRAARLSLSSLKRSLRPDGSGYIVKNRFPIEAKHGYEFYSAHSQYNLLACWSMAVAYLYANDAILEKPAPADIGGFVLPLQDVFHKVFANVAGNYIQYELSGDARYNPTGLIRIHLKNSNPLLGPSDGVVHWDLRKRWDYKDYHMNKITKLSGEQLAVGPAWFDEENVEHRLADYTNIIQPSWFNKDNEEIQPANDDNRSGFSSYKSDIPINVDVRVLKETPNLVSFEVIYEGDFHGISKVSQMITITPNGITIEDQLSGDCKKMRVYYPMLVFDGLEGSKVNLSKNSLKLFLNGGGIHFEMIEPGNSILKRTNKSLISTNGFIEAAYSDIHGKKAVYQIRSVTNP